MIRNASLLNNIRKSDESYTSFGRKINRYLHDPRRLYDGQRDEDAFLNAVGSIKAVRLG